MGGGVGGVGGGVGLGGVRVDVIKEWGGGQGQCGRKIEVFCENSKKKYFFLGGGGSGSGWGGVRVDVNEDLKFL